MYWISQRSGSPRASSRLLVSWTRVCPPLDLEIKLYYLHLPRVTSRNVVSGAFFASPRGLARCASSICSAWSAVMRPTGWADAALALVAGSGGSTPTSCRGAGAAGNCRCCSSCVVESRLFLLGAECVRLLRLFSVSWLSVISDQVS